MKDSVNVFWFRRDLRITDNAGFFRALQFEEPVVPVFVFDRDILERLENPADRRVDYIHQALLSLQKELIRAGSSLVVLHDTPLNAFRQITQKWNVRNVFVTQDYEPYATGRDVQVSTYLSTLGIGFISCKDQIVCDPTEVLKPDGTPYTVFTPYSRTWKKWLVAHPLKSYPSEQCLSSLLPSAKFPEPWNFADKCSGIPTLAQLGFQPTGPQFQPPVLNRAIILKYPLTRNFPAIEGTSRCSVALRFGTLSVREAVRMALELNEEWLNELIWREFFMSILFHFPYVEQRSFKKKYEAIAWRNNEQEFQQWCAGQTGYPMVDAGMRQLNETGWMHNRVRMITAGFLVKHLLIDWRWGEAYFAEKLLDYDLSANNGNWQWAAGSGCDAAPYFRIFNPIEQARTFDPENVYIKAWVPEWNTPDYATPIVEHSLARVRALEAYRTGLLVV